MKAVVQRVIKASVIVEDEVISSIGKGLCVLVGISKDDTTNDMEYIVRKILNTRVFEDDRGKRWNLSVKDKGYEILCISQFTLYHVLKGNKLDFHNAMAAEKSEAYYREFLGLMRAEYQADLIKGTSGCTFVKSPYAQSGHGRTVRDIPCKRCLIISDQSYILCF